MVAGLILLHFIGNNHKIKNHESKIVNLKSFRIFAHLNFGMRTKSLKKNKINVVTLGCSKNVYDSEVLMGQLKSQW